MLIVTGYPADDAQIPNINRKSLGEIATFRLSSVSGAEQGRHPDLGGDANG